MRFALYYAPALGTLFERQASSWFARPELRALTIAARRYGFHATIKAPMNLREGVDERILAEAVETFAGRHRPVGIGRLRPTPVDGFVALTPAVQSAELTGFAADVVEAFEPLRAPLGPAEVARRLSASLTTRQAELVGRYGYPYVLDQFRFHMTLTDRLDEPVRSQVLEQAGQWFGEALADELMLDRLVLFRETEPGADFERRGDYVLKGEAR
ncbi:MAG TPA: DUF1045 domain-containing protein [Devosia sp.]|nr:DUF1045 domain-containing protein [Devosia sp.]